MKFICLSILLLIIMSFASGCSRSLGIFVEEQPKPSLESLKDPTPVSLPPVEFKVITRENAEDVFSELESKNEEPVLIGLSGANYKKLALNIQELKRYIEMQKKLIEIYRKYYDSN